MSSTNFGIMLTRVYNGGVGVVIGEVLTCVFWRYILRMYSAMVAFGLVFILKECCLVSCGGA